MIFMVMSISPYSSADQPTPVRATNEGGRLAVIAEKSLAGVIRGGDVRRADAGGVAADRDPADLDVAQGGAMHRRQRRADRAHRRRAAGARERSRQPSLLGGSGQGAE